MIKVLSVFGTRPEAIKMAPVIKELGKYPTIFKSTVCVTGQHRQMLDQVLKIFDIEPDYDLKIMKQGQDLFDVTSNVLLGLRPVLTTVRPDIVLVHGDTTTTMAASLAAFYSGIPVGHVEAGLRTRNKRAPFPEEINRRITGCVADLHFAPTGWARQNLLAERVTDDTIYVTGNTVIDALFIALEKIKIENLEDKIIQQISAKNPNLLNVLSKLVSGQDSKLEIQNSEAKKIILVTGHRRENFGEGFENICRALKKIAQSNHDVEIIYPVHLNPNVQEPVNRILANCPCVHLIEPQDYLPFVWLMNRSYLIITDSGGIQEEAPSLGKPVLVMRDTTERPEGVEYGTIKLVGTNERKIVEETTNLLRNYADYDRMSQSLSPYGDGNASQRVIDVLRQTVTLKNAC